MCLYWRSQAHDCLFHLPTITARIIIPATTSIAICRESRAAAELVAVLLMLEVGAVAVEVGA